MSKQAVLNDVELKQDKANKIMEGINLWTSFYRANPHRFARDYLGLKLKRFQQIILCMMFQFTNSIYLASRGGGKSFLIAIFCVCYCILYPGTTVCIASGTRGQSTEIIEKIQTILMPDSPNLQMEIADIFTSQTKAACYFKNTSRIIVVTSAESARHNRATILIVDEFRMVDKNIIDTVLRKFLTSPRHPAFLDRAGYENYPTERTKEVYASSCWYESHWSYEHVRSYATNMARGRSYFCCAMPYQLAIAENLLDRVRVEDEMSETTFNEVTFQMEMEALFYGQGTDSLYEFDDIDKNRQIKYPFYPKSLLSKITDKRLNIPAKQPEEIRILSADIALMASSSRRKNDATSIFINQMLPATNGRFIKNIIYTENNEGLRTDVQALNIRKLFEEFNCDYLVLDVKGLGLGIVDALMADIFDAVSGTTYKALSCYNNEDIANRCAVKGAPKMFWAIQGSPECNSMCALSLREEFKQGLIRLLISEYDADDILGTMKGYGTLSVEDKMNLKLPYVHTTLLINELIKLEYEVKNKVIRVKEKSGMRKDRYSSLSYNIFVAKEIERDIVQENIKATKETIVFKMKAPKISEKYNRRS